MDMLIEIQGYIRDYCRNEELKQICEWWKSNNQLLQDYELVLYTTSTNLPNKHIDFIGLESYKNMLIPFSKEEFFALVNNETTEKYLAGIDFGINSSFEVLLDTNIVSEMRNKAKGNHIGNKKSVELVEELFVNKINIDIMPYVLENITKIMLGELRRDYFEENFLIAKLFLVHGPVVLKEYKEFIKKNESIYLSEKEEVANIIDSFLESNSHNQMLYLICYAYMLKACILKLNNSMSIKTDFIEFMFCDVNVASELEAFVAFDSFNNAESTKRFFKKVTCNNKNIINTVKGMSWDLFHIRMMLVRNDNETNADFMFKYFATNDKGVLDIFNSLQLKYYITEKSTDTNAVSFDRDILSLLTEEEQSNFWKIKEKRSTKKTTYNELLVFTKSLEIELNALMNK